jgi:hypothetical protein
VLLHALYLVAIVVEAMTAALAAGRRAMDWVGVCLLGSVTALGGGSMRDILLGHYPLSWVAHPYYLLVTAGAALFTIAIARIVHRLRPVFLVLDAIGLALFTVIGCNVALDLNLPFLIVIMVGHDHRLHRRRAARRAVQRRPAAVSQRALRQRLGRRGRPLCRGPSRWRSPRSGNGGRDGGRPGAAPARDPLRLEHAEIRLYARSTLGGLSGSVRHDRRQAQNFARRGIGFAGRTSNKI